MRSYPRLMLCRTKRGPGHVSLRNKHPRVAAAFRHFEMAKSQTPQGTRASTEVADSEIQVDDDSVDEIISVSNRSPAMPSSMERSPPPAQQSLKFWIELPPLPKDYAEYKHIHPPPLPKRAEEDSDSEDYSRVPTKLVGETVEKNKKYYYAEVKGGVVHQVRSATPFYSALVT
jgi:hypothetical protein